MSSASSSSSSAPSLTEYFVRNECTEVTLGLATGLQIAVKCWGPENADIRVLAVHGWLDNANTYDKLAPLLISCPKVRVRMVCMDFSGHGLSSHRPKTGDYSLADRVLELVGTADALHWDKFVLMGHSMGAAVAFLAAGTVPERVQKLILFDNLGTWPINLTAPELLRRAVTEQYRLLRRQRRVYPSLEIPVKRYLKSNPYMKEDSVRTLLARGTEVIEVFDRMPGGEAKAEQEMGNHKRSGDPRTAPAPPSSSTPPLPSTATKPAGAKPSDKRSTDLDDEDGDGEEKEKEHRETGIVFRHDPRLTGGALMKFSDADNIDFCKRIKCPVLCFLATNEERRSGQSARWKWMHTTYQQRAEALADLTMIFVEGSHHLHMDQAETVFPRVVDFLLDPALLPTRRAPIKFPPPAPSPTAKL